MTQPFIVLSPCRIYLKILFTVIVNIAILPELAGGKLPPKEGAASHCKPTLVHLLKERNNAAI
jgi:hypothetical protein